MSELVIPRFGELLSPYISQVPPEITPRFLALLERGAASRYRGWAEMLPEHAEGLMKCSEAEDEIANRIEGAFHLDESLREKLEAPLPGALDTYYEVFAQFSVWDQLHIQVNAERQGAGAWQRIASTHPDPQVIEVLNSCSALELESADYMDALIEAHAPDRVSN